MSNPYTLQTAGERSIANIDWLNHRTDGDTHTADWRLKLQKVMHNNAGVYRNEDLLAEGCSKMLELSKSIDENIRVTHNLAVQQPHRAYQLIVSYPNLTLCEGKGPGMLERFLGCTHQHCIFIP